MTHVEHAPAGHAPVWRSTVLMLALTVLSGCVSVRYQRPGRQIAPCAGETLVAGEHLPGFHDAQFATRAKALLGRACAKAQADTNNPARITLYGVGDTIIGHVILGRSTPADARRVMQSHGGLGPARENAVTFRVGPATLRPRLLYTPPRTLHQLYFDNDTLVLVVAGVPHELPSTRLEFMGRFPQARETHRESGWYELQTPLHACIWLIAVFGARTDRVESSGYAWTCRPA